MTNRHRLVNRDRSRSSTTSTSYPEYEGQPSHLLLKIIPNLNFILDEPTAPTMPPYKSPSSNPMVQLDPHHAGATIRKAFLLESILNLFTLPLIFFPRPILSYLLLNFDPTKNSSQNNATVFFAQCFGGLVVGALTPALWCGLPNTKSAIESRRTTYILLAGGEILLIPLLISQALKGGDVARGAAISPLVAVLAMGGLVPPLVWRGYVLLGRPELLGKYRDLDGKQE
jgi:hypothetical protein